MENGRRGGIIGRHAVTMSCPLHQFLVLQKRPVQYILLIYILWAVIYILWGGIPFGWTLYVSFSRREGIFFPLAGKEDDVYSAFLVVRFYLILRFLKQLKQNIDTLSF